MRQAQEVPERPWYCGNCGYVWGKRPAIHTPNMYPCPGCGHSEFREVIAGEKIALNAATGATPYRTEDA